MATILCRDIKFESIQTIIFDKDGTLADSQAFLSQLARQRVALIEAQIPGIGQALLKAMGVTDDCLDPAGLMAVGTRNANEIAAAAYVAETGLGWTAALQLVQTAFIQADLLLVRKADHTPLFAGVVPLLQHLIANGIKLALLSADTTVNVLDFAEKYQLSAYFQVAMGIDTGPAKPDPASFWQACQQLNSTPETTLVIGDSGADIEMARAGGAAGCIAVTWGGAAAILLTGATAIVDRPEEIQVSSS